MLVQSTQLLEHTDADAGAMLRDLACAMACPAIWVGTCGLAAGVVGPTLPRYHRVCL